LSRVSNALRGKHLIDGKTLIKENNKDNRKDKLIRENKELKLPIPIQLGVKSEKKNSNTVFDKSDHEIITKKENSPK